MEDSLLITDNAFFLRQKGQKLENGFFEEFGSIQFLKMTRPMSLNPSFRPDTPQWFPIFSTDIDLVQYQKNSDNYRKAFFRSMKELDEDPLVTPFKEVHK